MSIIAKMLLKATLHHKNSILNNMKYFWELPILSTVVEKWPLSKVFEIT